MAENNKKNRLKQILDISKPPIIIFANEKRSVDALAKVVEKWDWKVGIYHGSKTQ